MLCTPSLQYGDSRIKEMVKNPMYLFRENQSFKRSLFLWSFNHNCLFVILIKLMTQMVLFKQCLHGINMNLELSFKIKRYHKDGKGPNTITKYSLCSAILRKCTLKNLKTLKWKLFKEEII